MDYVEKEFDKIIYSFFDFLEKENTIYVGIKEKYIDWSLKQTENFSDTKEIKQHCQYSFKKGKLKGTLCLKKTEEGMFCPKHTPKPPKEEKETIVSKKCGYVMSSGKKCSKNSMKEKDYCAVHLKKLDNDETDFTIPDIPDISELMG